MSVERTLTSIGAAPWAVETAPTRVVTAPWAAETALRSVVAAPSAGKTAPGHSEQLRDVSGLSADRPKRDRVTRPIDSWDAVLPVSTGGAPAQVGGAWLGGDGHTLPAFDGFPPQAKAA